MDFDDLKAILTKIAIILINISNYCSVQEWLNTFHNDKVPFPKEPDRRDICLFNIEAYWTLFLSEINKLKECLSVSIIPTDFNDIVSNNPFVLWNYFFINARHSNIYNIENLKNERKKINKAIYEDYQKSIADNLMKIAFSSPFGDLKKELFNKSIKKYFNDIEKNEVNILHKRIHYTNGNLLNIEHAKELNSLIKSNKIEFLPPIFMSDVDLVNINKISKEKAMQLYSFVKGVLWEIWAEEKGVCYDKLFTDKDFINNMWSYWKEGKILKNLKDN